jgi:SAM-dependent methyltransferase
MASSMSAADAREVWDSGQAYEQYVGRWSRRVAEAFLEWLEVPAGRSWLDVGCGTGALSATILQRVEPAGVLGVDSSAEFLAHARKQVQHRRGAIDLGDAQALPLGDGQFDAAVSGLVLNFVPDPERMVAEMRRVVRPGGTVALYVWDYAGEMQLMRRFWDAAAALDPAARALDEGVRFPICAAAVLAELFDQAGLAGVATRAIDVPTSFRDFDDFWSPFEGGQGPAPGYCLSLAQERRAQLRDHLQATLPTQPDGRIELIARAWAVRGIVPRPR